MNAQLPMDSNLELTIRSEVVSKHSKIRPNWITEWISSCVVFALVLVGGFHVGQYDNMEHDTLFFATGGVCYLLCFMVAIRYFRKKR